MITQTLHATYADRRGLVRAVPKIGFTSLILCFVLCTALHGQSIWLGQISPEWSDAANWSNGIPGPGNNASIPTEPVGPFLPEVSEAITINFSIENANSLVFQAPVNHAAGTIINFETAQLIFVASITNLDSLDNDGTMIVNGDFINHGDYNNSGTLLMEPGGQLRNEASARFDNYGDIELDQIQTTNLGEFNSYGGIIRSNGYFRNAGDIFNNGILYNEGCGIVQNDDQIENQHIIRNDNLLYNSGDFFGNPVEERIDIYKLAGSYQASEACQDLQGWVHYKDPTADKILLSINANGADIGSLTDQSLVIKLHNEPALGNGVAKNLNDAAYVDSDDWLVLNRYWSITSTRQLTGPVKIRFYFLQSDFADIKRSLPLTQGVNELSVYQLNDTSDGYALDIPTNQVKEFNFGTAPAPGQWSLSAVSFCQFIEIETDQLNAAFVAGVKSWIGGTIPFLADFAAKARRSTRSADLSWFTTQEKKFDTYSIERSFDGFTFQEIHSVPAAGESEVPITYNFTDSPLPTDSTLFYRLVLTMSDGSKRFGPTRMVSFDDTLVKLFPNPSDQELYLQFSEIESGSVEVFIYDLNGSLRFSESMTVENNRTTENLFSKVYLGNGIYSLKIKIGTQSESIRFLKISR